MVTIFLYSLAGGMLLVLATAKLDLVASRFLRLIGFLTFALSCGVSIWLYQYGQTSESYNQTGDSLLLKVGYNLGLAHALAAMGIVLISPFHQKMAKLLRFVCAVGGIAGVMAACILAVEPWQSAHGFDASAILMVSGQVVGSWLLGSITIAWLVGHAYLTATKMTIEPLRHFSRVLSWTVIARLMFLGLSLALAGFVTLSSEGAQEAATLRGTSGVTPFHMMGQSWLVLSLRVGVGLAAVAIFAYMVADCVRLRAIQSATGILYFCSVFVYIGELASQYLTVKIGWPV